MEKYVIGIFGDGVNEALKGVRAKQKWLKRKTDELAKRLADMGATYAQFDFDHAQYSGNTDVAIEVKKVGTNAYKVTANGESVLFVEFGAGIRHGYGHPEPGEYGPGTYPGKGHWNDPRGWWYETDDPSAATKTSKRSGKSWVHTYGNAPAAPMYNAVKTLKEELQDIVREVFESE